MSAPLLPSLATDVDPRYEPQALLGAGAHGFVIRALDRQTGELVAIKQFQTSPNSSRKFVHEFQLLMRLRHPNIIPCLNIFLGEGSNHYLVLEYAAGGSFRERMEEGRAFSVEGTLTILLQIARGLAYAHEQGIVHRDLKPENFLISIEAGMEVLKIGDFGIAKFLGRDRHTRTNVGSPAYMAPEQFYDRYDYKSDIYSIGVFFFELLHGERPFDGSPADLFKGHLEGAVPISVPIPDTVRELLEASLAKQPADRPTASEFLARLESLMGATGSPGIPPPSLRVQPTRQTPAPEDAAPLTGAGLFGGMFPDVQSPLSATVPQPPAAALDLLAESTQVDLHETPFTDSQPVLGLVPESQARKHEPPAAAPFTASDDDDDDDDFFAAFDSSPRAPRVAPAALPAADPGPTKPPPRLPTEPPPPAPPTIAGGGESSKMFAEMFSGDKPLRREVIDQRIRPADIEGDLECTMLWSRAVETTARAVADCGRERALVLVTNAGLLELQHDGRRGREIHSGRVERLGLPTPGCLPLVEDGRVRVVSLGVVSEPLWSLQGSMHHFAVANSGSHIATALGSRLAVYDREGSERWVGQFDARSTGLHLAYDTAGSLTVLGLGGSDHTLRLFDAEGAELGAVAIPGEPVVACAAMEPGAVWLTVRQTRFHVLMKASAAGCSKPIPLPGPPSAMHAGSGWVALTVSERELLLISASGNGAMARIALRGSVLGVSTCADPAQIAVLEQRGDLLRYISVFHVGTPSSKDAPSHG